MVSLSSLVLVAFDAGFSDMRLILPGDLGRRPTGRRNDRGDPTPSHQAPHTDSRPAATSASERRGRGARRRTAATRRPIAARACRRLRRRCRPAPLGQRPRDESLVGACRLDSSPTRPSEVRRRACSPPASRARSHLANENVLALIPRCSTGGTRKPEGQRVPHRGREGNARVTTATLATRWRRPRPRPQERSSTSSRAGVGSGQASRGRRGGRAPRPVRGWTRW